MTGERSRQVQPQTVRYEGRFIPARPEPAFARGVHLGRRSYRATIELFDVGGVPAIRGIEVRVHFGAGSYSDIIAHSYDASSPVSLAHESYAVSRASRFSAAGGDCAPQARCRIRPFLGGARIDPGSATQLPDTFLFDELDARLVHGPVLWRLLAQSAGSATVKLGTIALDARVRDYVPAELAETR